MTERYLNEHRSQYDPDCSTRTRHQGCVWTSLSNGIDAATGGLVVRSPDQVLSLVRPTEETNPTTPGWSLHDASLAMQRLRVPFEVHSGEGWDAVLDALSGGHYVILQGDSDRFSDATCSGVFDGDHCIGVHPDRDSEDRQRIDDPVCPDARYSGRSILRMYAEKLNPHIYFGVFTHPVPIRYVPVYWATVGGRTQTYDRSGRPLGYVSGFRTKTAERIKVGRRWLFRIVDGKYEGRYLPAVGTVTYTRIA